MAGLKCFALQGSQCKGPRGLALSLLASLSMGVGAMKAGLQGSQGVLNQLP